MGGRSNPRRRPTATSPFGVSRRENHDSSGFYSRFTLPTLSADDAVAEPLARDVVYRADARRMNEVAPNSVALVVTSPPYFAGKEYEQALGEGHVPSSYVEYLEMLLEVLAQCAEKLEPGGRIAINVANLGRRPYRSLSADVIHILQDRLGLLLRGEIIWQKAEGASGSTAWGSFGSSANPVLRDLTERIIVASKGRFDRALTAKQRQKRNLPWLGRMFRDEFMEATTDVWVLPTESAKRVGHPAPFPVELPQRLIELYTFKGDLVLDPFMGAGSTAVAALRTGRHFVGYELEERYHRQSEERVAEERERLDARQKKQHRPLVPSALPVPAGPDEDFQARAVREGKQAKEIARAVIEHCGFEIAGENERVSSAVEINFVARDRAGERWFFDVSGAFTTIRPGLRRTDTLWKSLGRASVVKAATGSNRVILLTTHLPQSGGAGLAALKAARGDVFFDAIEMLSKEGQQRLICYAEGDGRDGPIGDLLMGEE